MKKIILLLILIITVIFIYTNKYYPNNEYNIIKQDTNASYEADGQKNIKDKDGYFTIFQTPNKTYKEYKQNLGSWKKNSYWGGTMEDSGCGITALSIILSGYDLDYTPESLRKKYYPVLDSTLISNELNNLGINNSDFFFDSVHLSNEYIKNHLMADKPILICVWNNPNENRWTTTSHYMVLLAATNNDMVYVSNPNGLYNTGKSSGWYNINEVTPYINKALFIES